jgi:hypothetical protein
MITSNKMVIILFTEDAFTEKTKDLILQELRETFTPELAHTAYIPFCKLAGGYVLHTHTHQY